MFTFDFDNFLGIRPGGSVDRLRRELGRAFEYTAAADSFQEIPALNITQKEDSLVVTAELPGVTAEDLEITVLGNTFSLQGERKREPLEDGERYIRKERSFGKFERSIELPFSVDSDKVQASFAKGVLTVVLPQAERNKPRKIVVS